MAHTTAISKFYQSFSGTDTLVFMLFPGCKPALLGSLTTVSYSMYRNKKPVVNIGRININGVTRGTRIFAGTMIFTLINQHWLKELQESDTYCWFSNYSELKPDELPLFDLMVVSANEYGNCVSMYIYGVDITDEAQSVSIEDLFTENTFSFVARDVSLFKRRDVLVTSSDTIKDDSKEDKDKSTQRIFVLDNSSTTLDDVERLQAEMNSTKINEEKIRKAKSDDKKVYGTLTRELYYNYSEPLIGQDISRKMIELLLMAYTIEILIMPLESFRT
jgi:hypothetical protein